MMLAPTLAAMLSALTPLTSWPGQDGIPTVPYPVLRETAANVKEFVPAGWNLDGEALGDLNRDGVADVALVLRKDDSANRLPIWESDPDTLFDSNPRVLMIAFGKRGGGFIRKVAEHRLITRLEQGNMDDPFDEVAIVRGTLQVKLRAFMSAGGWWMGNFRFTFRWQNDALQLIGYDRDGVTRNTGVTDGTSINFLTRTRTVSAGTISEDKDTSHRREHFKLRRLLRIDEVGDGLMFATDQ